MTNLENKEMELPVKEEVVASAEEVAVVGNDVENTAETEVTDCSLENNEVSETTETEVAEYKTLDATEIFSDRRYAIGKAKKLMNGKFGGGFYASYLQDTGSKTGHLQLTIEYPDGQIKRVYLAKNCFKPLENESDGLAKVEVDGKEIVPKKNERLLYGDFRALEKYETPNMPIPSKVLWKLIIDNYEKIPVVAVYQTEDFEGIYWQLYGIAAEEASKNIASSRINKVSFLVTREEMEEVASDNGWTLSQLRTELNLRGMLIKDKPLMRDGNIIANSYQFTKKVGGKNHRFYAIRKRVDVTIEKEADEDALMEFTESTYETEQEKELRELRMAKMRLENEVKEKDNKIYEIFRTRVPDATFNEIHGRIWEE